MIWLVYEDRRRHALEAKIQPPTAPILNLPSKDADVIDRILKSAPSHFIPFCLRLFAFMQDHGTDVLQYAPVPFHPLPIEQQQPILRALRDPAQKLYMEYVCRWQDAMLAQQKVPTEPETKMRSKQRKELWKVLFDLRAVMFFKQRVHATSVA